MCIEGLLFSDGHGRGTKYYLLDSANAGRNLERNLGSNIGSNRTEYAQLNLCDFCGFCVRLGLVNCLSRLNGLYTPFVSPVPGGQKPQKGTNGRCSTLVEESNGEQNNLLEYTVDWFISLWFTVYEKVY